VNHNSVSLRLTSALKTCATLASHPLIALDYTLYRLGRKAATSPFDARLEGSTYSELRTIRNLTPGPREQALIRSLPHQGVFIDVGAHVGLWTSALAMAHPAATVHAFEASPDTFRTLQRNIETNNIANAILNQTAVSDVEGSIQFQAPRNGSVFGRIRADGNSQHRFDNAAIVDVPALRLADYCRTRGITNIDFLKIDVEGAEIRVLRGVLSHIPIGRIWIEIDELNLADMGTRLPRWLTSSPAQTIASYWPTDRRRTSARSTTETC
jgi:FkbM family methyltransferase